MTEILIGVGAVGIVVVGVQLASIVSALISIENRLSYRQGSDLYFLIRDLREWLERDRMRDKLR